jgi:hypothetical protein
MADETNTLHQAYDAKHTKETTAVDTSILQASYNLQSRATGPAASGICVTYVAKATCPYTKAAVLT